MRGGAVVARWAHNPKVASSSLAPATKKKPDTTVSGFFYLQERQKLVFVTHIQVRESRCNRDEQSCPATK